MGYSGGGGGGGGSGGSGGGGAGGYGAGGSGSAGGSGYRRVGDDRTANLKVNNITNRDGSSGTEVDGVVEINSTSHFVLPFGTTSSRYSDRGENIVRDRLVIHLDANYSYSQSDGYWYDLSGNENNAEVTSNVIYRQNYFGSHGGSLDFNGSGVRTATIKESPTTNISGGNFTISSWFYIPTVVDITNLYYTIFAFGTGVFGSQNSFYLKIWRSGISPGAIYSRINDVVLIGTDGDDSTAYVGDAYKASGRWTHFTFVEDNGISYYYINGVQTGNKATPTIPSGHSKISIGKGNDTAEQFVGEISTFSLYQKALTQEEITQNYNANRRRFGL